MDKFKLIKINNLDRLGKYYFEKAINFTSDKEFGKAHEYLKEGLDSLTCDCLRYDWYKDINENTFIDIDNHFTNKNDYYFVKAFFLSYKTDLKSLYLALDAIDNYLNYITNEDYGYFIKGKILVGLKEHEKAYDFFKKALHIKPNSRNCYYFGRIKEKVLKQNSLDLIFDSLKQNHTSLCGWQFFKERFDFYNISMTGHEDNILFNSFIEKDNVTDFTKLLSNTIESSIDNESNIKIISDFLEIVKKYSYTFSGNFDDDNNWDLNPYNPNNFEENYYNSSESESYYNDQLDMDQQSQDFWESL